ncbi:hypothetical protein KL86PLE_10188 [uncultured Pleomorphomonas sp.]|uniref:Uncharacterized protein n=1 Tax=uncultured Pleomorphomonas sp. TaxID=442121 RepID=A0A212KYY6_9HYPH|nr:hypothetical protein KL86PLE_10188 [uncultured Pleomorphomonas sp.]
MTWLSFPGHFAGVYRAQNYPSKHNPRLALTAILRLNAANKKNGTAGDRDFPRTRCWTQGLGVDCVILSYCLEISFIRSV